MEGEEKAWTAFPLITGAFMTKISGLPLSDSPKPYQADPRPASCLTDMTTTANVLTTRTELCDVLLGEISGIRSSLAKDLQRTREPPLALI